MVKIFYKLMLINNKKLELIIEGRKILLWKGQYVQEAEADFYQILALGRKTISLLY